MNEVVAKAEETVDAKATAPRGNLDQWLIRGMFAVALIVLVIAALTAPGFATKENAKAILSSMGSVGILAVGMSAIMISGNLFSLSLGITATVMAMLYLSLLGLGWVLASLIVLVAGALVCALQGLIIGGINGNPIIVTIGAGSALSGLAAWVSGGKGVYPAGGASTGPLSSAPFGLSSSVYLLAVLAVLVWLFMTRTSLGRQMYLVGENRPAARAAGLLITRVTCVAFGVAGLCAALAGVYLGAVNKNANLFNGNNVTYDAIAAVLVGGSAVTGGHGSVGRSVLGALVIAAISDVLLLRGYSTGAQIMVKGLVVFVVVLSSALLQKRRRAA